MISPRGMRGKGIGFADWPVVPAMPRLQCLALGSPWTVWRPRRPCGSRPLDKVRRSPGIGHMPHRADLARCSRLHDKPLGSLRPLASLGLPTGQGWDLLHAPLTPLAPLGRHRPTCASIGPRGKGQAVPWLATHRRGAAGPEIPFGPAFRLKASIDKLRVRSPYCRVLQSDKTSAPPRPAMNSRRFNRSPRRRAAGSMWAPRCRAVSRFTTISNFVGI
jgi:hypothetical protein